MTHIARIVLFLLRKEPRSAAIGLVLSVVVLVMGTALLGLSGWFITAAAAAGLAGLGILFNVFAPSAMVRFLALGRTAARYGERLATHDTVLRALTALRLQLIRGLLTRPFREIERLRVASALNRLTADVDALDGALLRLVFPALAGGATILLASVVLWWLVHPGVALVVGLGYLAGPTLVFVLGQHTARKPSRQAEAALQATRGRIVEMIRAREDLTVYGQIPEAIARCDTAVERHRTARTRLDRVERTAGFGLDLMTGAVTTGALGLGATLAEQGTIEPARAAIGVFVALALGEAVAPIRRALTEVGRMAQAARRLTPALAKPSPGMGDVSLFPARPPGLRFENVTWQRHPEGVPLFAPLSFGAAPGETVALTGASGIGKSTLLLIAAGALDPSAGQVTLHSRDVAELSPTQVTDILTMVPQRHGLISGTIRENLALAAPEADDSTLWRALHTACLADTLKARGGLDSRLGPRGAGLSGGEARRLVLARAVLRQPEVLLLDEPTEGLDTATARMVMAGIRTALPNAAILLAAHRAVEREAADRVITLRHPDASP